MQVASLAAAPLSTSAPPDDGASRPASLLLQRYAWLVLAYNIFVILWGAVVRATSSGDGCGAHWPLCNGTVLQHHPKAATLIELAHRMSSGVALLSVLVLLVWTWRASLRGALARVTSSAAMLLMINEAFLGAMLVKLGYVDKNVSTGRSVVLAMHLANTLLMLAVIALTAHFLSRGRTLSRFALRTRHLPLALIGLGATMVVGITGSLAALGDTLFPSQTLVAALSEDLSSQANWLIRVRILHPLSALITAGFILWLLWRAVAVTKERSSRQLAWTLVALLGFQIVLGIADVALLAPVWLQVLHLLGADCLWAAMVILAARVCLEPQVNFQSGV